MWALIDSIQTVIPALSLLMAGNRDFAALGLCFLALHLFYRLHLSWQDFSVYLGFIYIILGHTALHLVTIPSILPRSLLAIIALLFHLNFPVFRFPAPTGPHAVGTASFQWVDTARPGWFFIPSERDPPPVATRLHRRDIMCQVGLQFPIALESLLHPLDIGLVGSPSPQVWYPAETPISAPLASWIPNHGRVFVKELAAQWHLPRLILNHLTRVKSRAFLNAAPRVPGAGEGPYPVVVFSHGYTGMRFQNTHLCQELASWGQVVFSVEHPFDASVSILCPSLLDPLQALGQRLHPPPRNASPLNPLPQPTAHPMRAPPLVGKGWIPLTVQELVSSVAKAPSMRLHRVRALSHAADLPAAWSMAERRRARQEELQFRVADVAFALNRICMLTRRPPAPAPAPPPASGPAAARPGPFDAVSLSLFSPAMLDLSRLALMGHSFGGATAVATAVSDALVPLAAQDVHVRAVVSLDGWAWPLSSQMVSDCAEYVPLQAEFPGSGIVPRDGLADLPVLLLLQADRFSSESDESTRYNRSQTAALREWWRAHQPPQAMVIKTGSAPTPSETPAPPTESTGTHRRGTVAAHSSPSSISPSSPPAFPSHPVDSLPNEEAPARAGVVHIELRGLRHHDFNDVPRIAPLGCFLRGMTGTPTRWAVARSQALLNRIVRSFLIDTLSSGPTRKHPRGTPAECAGISRTLVQEWAALDPGHFRLLGEPFRASPPPSTAQPKN
ncbi:hypothetical protein PAPYR_4574 [Paratrimastix pyriformis]|uniref:1-alkyl-2-acetylglycerophosphocholine esterase n=1 Tax=Paratrimastix pyriformis TaxID=342808 RepID=A0ABQ8UPR0_9EUKA|nr:hypothetical protein PAPYR_4574 [Paratrimastix pyriformis]